ncbi:MAG TPA: SulP family inorganic anion transporter [Kiloniellales bacterium]|nr:SulP family inorganic anion transporter [Kiloniellales bacterium]
MSETALPAGRPSAFGWLTTVVLAGALSGFLAAFFSISDATFIFGLSMPALLPIGIGVALLSTAVLAAVTALSSSIPGVVAQTQEVPLATLAVVAASIPGLMPAGASETATFTTLLCTLGASTLVTGLFFFLLGYFRLGRFIRYVPLPVIAGFIAGMGLILLLGSVEVVAGRPLELATLEGWLSASVLAKLALAGGLALLLHVLPRLTQSALATPAAILGAVLLFHAVARFVGIESLTSEGWFVSVETGSNLWGYGEYVDFATVEWGVIASQALTIATMVLVSAMALLMTSSAIELAIHRDVDVNGELKAAGAANLCAGLIGGIPGFQGFSLTLLNWRLGAATRATSLVVAVVCLAILALGAPLLSVVPIPIFGGLLLWLSVSLLEEWLVATWKRLSKGEYLVILLIVAVIASLGFLEGLLVGLIAGVVIFVVDYSRVDIVNARLSGQVLRSSVELSGERQKVLAAHGDAILILRLQGYIFFGTADRLRERILSWVASSGPTPISFLLIDFRRASGMDSSAALTFRKLVQLTAQGDFRLVLTGLSKELRQTLERGGMPFDPAGPVRAYPTLDRGLRWCEQKLLGRVAPLLASDDPYQIQEQLLSGIDRGEHGQKLLSYMTRASFPQDHVLIEQGTASEEMYFIEAGRLSVHLAKSDGGRLRLKTLGPGTTVGELAFYLHQRRSASVVCDTDTVAWRFGHDDLQRMAEQAPDLAALFHRRMAVLLSERLAATNRLVQVLLD